MNEKGIIPYIAGLMDGEGCITITRRKSCKNRIYPNNYWYYEPQTIISNTNKKVLSFCLSYYGGWIATVKMCKREHATVYHWKLTGDKMRGLLTDIIPYLIVKKKQAHMILFFPRYGGNGRKSRTDTERQEQERLWLAIKKLNSG